MAAEYLQSQGCEILARNWRRPEGELDIVALDHGVCAFVEVRSRTGIERGHPLETIGRSKRARVVRAAQLYLQERSPGMVDFRFDVAGVIFPPDGNEPELIYVKDAFRTP